MHSFYGRPEVQIGYEIHGGTVCMKQVQQMHDYGEAAVDLHGGRLMKRNVRIGPIKSRK